MMILQGSFSFAVNQLDFNSKKITIILSDNEFTCILVNRSKEKLLEVCIQDSVLSVLWNSAKLRHY